MKPIKLIRTRLLGIFFTGFILLLLMVVLQTIGEKYGMLFYMPWIWLLVLYIPIIITVLKVAAGVGRRNAVIIIILSVGYVFLTLLSILLQQYVASSLGILPYLAFTKTLVVSAIILIPFEIFLIYLIRKTSPFKKLEENNSPLIEVDPKVFISYNHNDSEIALKIRDVLKRNDIEVIIDQEDMVAGTEISHFIEKSIAESTVTVSIISNQSLKSAWVALETINTFSWGKYQANKKFIACYLEDDFFKSDYTLKTIEKIDGQIKANQNLIPEYQRKMLDTRDLNHENTRLFALRNNLDAIVGKLKDSLCLDVRRGTFDQSMQKLLAAIQNP